MASRILDINICLGAWGMLEGSLISKATKDITLLCGRFLNHTPLSVPFRQLLGYQNMWEVACDRNAPQSSTCFVEKHMAMAHNNGVTFWDQFGHFSSLRP